LDDEVFNLKASAIHDSTRQKIENTHTYIPGARFEPTIPVFAGSKTYVP